MPDEIYGVMAVKNGQKQTIMNLSNARQKSYADLQNMTDAQKKGVIICPDYPKEEFLVTADEVSYGSGTVAGALDVEDITSQCTVDSTKVSSIGTFRVLKQGHLVMIFMGNFYMVAAGDNQSRVVTGLPKAAEQGSSQVSGETASKSAAINASGTVCWISKGFTSLSMHVGNVTSYRLWTNLFYFCE